MIGLSKGKQTQKLMPSSLKSSGTGIGGLKQREINAPFAVTTVEPCHTVLSFQAVIRSQGKTTVLHVCAIKWNLLILNSTKY